MNEQTKQFQNKALYEYLCVLDPLQFKMFYSILVYYWGNCRYFISLQNFFNLWCELNLCCHELDESFPDQYDDHELIRDFCHAHPYYFIDRLPIELRAGLFADYVDDRVEILTNVAKIISEGNLHTALTYTDQALGRNEPIEPIVAEILEHIKLFSE